MELLFSSHLLFSKTKCNMVSNLTACLLFPISFMSLQKFPYNCNCNYLLCLLLLPFRSTQPSASEVTPICPFLPILTALIHAFFTCYWCSLLPAFPASRPALLVPRPHCSQSNLSETPIWSHHSPALRSFCSLQSVGGGK